MAVKVQWNPLDPASIRDPYPIYSELRENHPVYWHAGMSSWVLTRYDDCQMVLRDHAIFARDRRRVGVEMPDERINIQKQDPPEQAALRGITGKALVSLPLEQICADARILMAEKLQIAAKNGPFDMMRDVAGPAAIHVINRIFGVDEYTYDGYSPIYQGLTQNMDSGLAPSRRLAGHAAGDALRVAVDGWLERRLGHGEVSMLGALYANEEVGTMPGPYVRNTLVAIYNAGFSTAYASMGAITHELLAGGGLDAICRLDTANRPALILAAEELLRYTSPAQATARVAVARTELQGVTINPGETVVTMLAAANRDRRQFDSPDQLVLDRSPNQHLAFAWGPHICLGARLAQAWVVEIIKFLSEFGPRLRLRGGEQYMNAATLRNLMTLPIEYV